MTKLSNILVYLLGIIVAIMFIALFTYSFKMVDKLEQNGLEAQTKLVKQLDTKNKTLDEFIIVSRNYLSEQKDTLDDLENLYNKYKKSTSEEDKIVLDREINKNLSKLIKEAHDYPLIKNSINAQSVINYTEQEYIKTKAYIEDYNMYAKEIEDDLSSFPAPLFTAIKEIKKPIIY